MFISLPWIMDLQTVSLSVSCLLSFQNLCRSEAKGRSPSVHSAFGH